MKLLGVEMPEITTLEAAKEFLETQLNGAINALRRKDATEAACIERLEAFYKTRFEEIKDNKDKMIAMHERAIERLGLDANRYRFMRGNRVVIRKFKISAKLEALDAALDALMTEWTKKQEAQPVHNLRDIIHRTLQ